MCIQCIAGAMSAGAAATGMRAWVVARFGHVLTGRRRRALTVGLIAGGVLAGGLVGPTP
jgi:hypothetical protein